MTFAIGAIIEAFDSAGAEGTVAEVIADDETANSARSAANSGSISRGNGTASISGRTSIGLYPEVDDLLLVGLAMSLVLNGSSCPGFCTKVVLLRDGERDDDLVARFFEQCWTNEIGKCLVDLGEAGNDLCRGDFVQVFEFCHELCLNFVAFFEHLSSVRIFSSSFSAR